ncbi:MAG: dehydrogenase E1 component subunit alpha/beta [Opitutaceae bacterium]|nr:dehydrogenase E1 component subunit alpha/beta [Cytophagales bacterium]
MIQYDRSDLSDEILRSLYYNILKPRLVEEKMLLLIRQGKLSKWFSGIGQEAVSAGVVSALKPDEYILPLHRNLGVFTGRDVPLQKLFAQFQGKISGFTKGRDRSFHFGSREHHIIGMISHLGAMLPVADGIALGEKLAGKNKVCVAFIGEGGTSEGDFHEALNLAAVWKLPVIFLVENNGYSISTPISEQFAIKSFTDKAAAYNIEAQQIDGNNVIEVYKTIKDVAERLKASPAPVLIEAITFRMRGHEEASSTKLIPEALFEQWAAKDPVENFERFIKEQNILSHYKIAEIKTGITSEIEKAWEAMENEPEIPGSIENETNDIYSLSDFEVVKPGNNTRNIRFVDSINEGLDESMKKHPELILMGQDIAEFGGVFKATEHLFEKYGKERVRNTPICESAVIGAGLGLTIAGYKSVIEMQFSDFVSCGFNQVVNNLAKSHYRWGQNADVVIRMPTGAGTQSGPFHSQSTEAWFFHVPGLKIVYPSSPYAAKGLLCAAINDPNPVLFFEHKALYRSVQGEVPQGYYTLPLGKANVLNEGTSLTLITYGASVHWCKEIIEKNDLDKEVELIDLQSLNPLDLDTLFTSARKTGKVLLVTEDTHTGSIMAEISSSITENLFEFLDAPVKRLSSKNWPVPFNEKLENFFLPRNQVLEKIQELLEY